MNLEELQLRQKVGDVLFTLLILVIMLDPPNTILHLKDPIFVLTVGYNMAFFKPDWKYLPHFLVVVACMLVSYVLSEMQMNAIDYKGVLAGLKSIAPLILLLWVGHYNLIKLAVIPTFVACVVQLTVFVLSAVSEPLQYGIFLYMGAHDFPIMMSHRTIMGVEIFSVYYKSQVSFMFATFIGYYWLFNKKMTTAKFIMCLIAVVIFTSSFLTSGTRSTMLTPFVLMGIALYCRFRHTRYARYAVYPMIALAVACFLFVIFTLASETQETSNLRKYAHIPSYIALFAAHPEYLIFGQGAGTMFYSQGALMMVDNTEWTYIEIFRRYGLLALPILAVIFAPLKPLIINNKDNITFGILWVYITYIFVAGTNPLLFSSTGMIMVLMAYCYVEQIKNNK